MTQKKRFPRVPEWARAKPQTTIESDLRSTKERNRLRIEDQNLHKITELEDVLEPWDMDDWENEK